MHSGPINTKFAANAASLDDSQPKLTPYVIGITGHRRLDSAAKDYCYHKMLDLIDHLQGQLKTTPLVVVSGLADGADRLMAKAALQRNIEVHAQLPLTLDEYRKDFSNDSWRELNELLSHPLVSTNIVDQLHDTKQSEALTGEARDQQYWVLGQHLISVSNLLVTVWDGENTLLTGGTSDVLLEYLDILPRRKQDRIKTQSQPITYLYPEDGSQMKGRLAYWLPVTKVVGDMVIHTRLDETQDDCFLSGELGNYELECLFSPPESLNDDLTSLDEYNRKVLELTNDHCITKEYSLLQGYNIDKSPIRRQSLISLDEEFLKADSVAMANQRHSDEQFALFSALAAVMGVMFLIYAKIVASSILLIGYLVLMVVGLFYYRNIQRRHSFTNHLTARVLAETLRTQFYLTLLHRSNHKHPTQIMNNCGVSQFTGFNWIKQIILSKVPMHLGQDRKYHLLDYNLDFVVTHWVEDQAKYFKRKSQQLSHRHHRLEKIKSYLFVLSFIMAGALVLFKYDMVGIALFGDVTMKNIVVLLMGLLPFLLGVWEIYQTKMAVKELFWQYSNQSHLFQDALHHINNAANQEQKCTVITELAERALLENYIWIIHRFHREHEPPSAG